MAEPSRKGGRGAGAARLALFYLVVFKVKVVQGLLMISQRVVPAQAGTHNPKMTVLRR